MRPALLLALSLIGAAPARAAFEDFDISPRTVGMGSAYTALARGPAGLAYNAAGLADLSYIETELSYARLFESPPGRVDLTGLSVAAALPTRWGQREGGFGLEWLIT